MYFLVRIRDFGVSTHAEISIPNMYFSNVYCEWLIYTFPTFLKGKLPIGAFPTFVSRIDFLVPYPHEKCM